LSWFTKLLGRAPDDTALALYNGVIATARAPHWYEAGGVPDSLDGRFDMVAAVLSLVLLRVEDAAALAHTQNALLALRDALAATPTTALIEGQLP
jgi:cytochrome b pre-mRNA-processing protein 3